MASPSGIRAGAAYVQVGADLSPLMRGLRQAVAAVRSAGVQMQRAGSMAFAGGAAGLGGMLHAAQAFARSGDELTQLSVRSGMSVEALSELRYAAEMSDTDFASLATSVRYLQRSIAAAADGTGPAAEAIAALGLSTADLIDLHPDQQFERVAAAMAAMSNPIQRTAAAMALFGRSGTDIVPMLKELPELRAEAQRLGITMSAETVAAATRLDDAFDRLGQTAKRLWATVGEALAPLLETLADDLTAVVVRVKSWVAANGEMITDAFKALAALTALSAAVATLGTAIVALTSPVVVITGALASIGMAALAVTDALGITNTGFRTLFDSIRLGGTGLGTWLAAFFTFIQQGFMVMVDYLRARWNEFIETMKLATLTMKVAFAATPGGRAMVGYVPDLSGVGTENRADALKRQIEFHSHMAQLRSNLFQTDAGGGPAWGIDTNAARRGLSQIGGGLMAGIRSAWDVARGGLAAAGGAGPRDISQSEWAAALARRFGAIAPAGVLAAPSIPGVSEAMGGFDTSALDRMGVGGTLADRTAKAAEETARNTREISRKLDTGFEE